MKAVLQILVIGFAIAALIPAIVVAVRAVTRIRASGVAEGFWRRSEVVFVDVYMMCPTVRVIKDGREIAYKRCDYGAEALAETVAAHFPDLRDELANQ